MGAPPQVAMCPEYMPEGALQNAVWMGGAVLSKIVIQQNQQITKYDYEESGPSIVHRKCAP